MAQLTISAAARLCDMDRRTLQRAIHAGRLHLDAQHCLSTDELLLAGYLIADTPQDVPQARPQYAPHETPQEAPQITPPEMPLLPLLERLTLAVEGLAHEVRQLRESLRQAPQGPPQAAPHEPPPDPVLAQIRRWQEEGMTLRAIAARLNADGVPTRSGTGRWYASNLSRLLAREAKRHPPGA
jgi:hypothetical protein